jgi:hypothetical protein
MSAFGLGRVILLFLSVTLALSGIVIAGGAHPLPRKTAVMPKSQTLFRCKTDHVFLLPRVADAGENEQSYAIQGQRSSKGELVLSVDSKNHGLTLLLQSRGGPTRAYVLTNVEQGSSGGSGAGGRADTSIRGTSAGKVFTLFAEYENFSDEDAHLMIEGRTTSLLSCRNGHYAAPSAKGLGRYGTTNIFVLSADALAQKMKTLPREPVVQNGKVSFFVPE